MSTRIGILGFAHGHVNAYCNQWRQNPDMGVRLIAGHDRDPARLAEAAGTHQIEAVDDAAALLARADIDAVVIAAETAFHADLVEQAAAAGKAIILQKPMALSMDEADRIIAAVQRAGVPFTMAWQMRADPQNIEMKRLLDEGVIGRVFMLRRRHGLSTHLWGEHFASSWHVDVSLNRGMWADDAAHAADFLLWMLGEPVSVTAEIATLHNPRVPDDNGIAIYRYAAGTFAEIVSSFTCAAAENTTEIIGEGGCIIQNYGDGPSCNVPRPEGGIGLKWYSVDEGRWQTIPIPSPPDHGHRITALAEPLAAFLHGQGPPIATVAEGRAALKMTLAAYESARDGRRIDLTEL